MKKTEVLAPCGGMQALEAALRTGCDAVYLGGTQFSARQNASNFTEEQLEEAVKMCHIRGVKVYQAINTVIMDSELDNCIKAVKKACELGVDALITQDLALVKIVRECCPELEIHASTQMTLHSERGVMFAKQTGFSRAVVSRELNKEVLSRICRLPIEIEIFTHGALCMSVSGQCYMSAIIGSRSANRGLCAQACRLPVSAIQNKRDRFDLSLKDMSFANHISELQQMGASSLKIEGRMKRPEYVAAAVNAMRCAVDGKPYSLDTLEKIFSRSGFTDGYFTSSLGKNMFGYRRKEDVENAAGVIPELHELYRHEYKRSDISAYVKIKNNEPLYISFTDENGICAEFSGDIPEQAMNRPTDKALVEKQLSKLGNTIYTLCSLESDIDDGLCVPAGVLNSARRYLCEELDRKRYEFYTHKPAFREKTFSFKRPNRISFPKIRISVYDAKQIDGVDIDSIELIYCTMQTAEKLIEKISDKNKLCVSMPRFTFDEQRDFQKLKSLTEKGISHIECTNYAHILMGKELNLTIHGGFGLNVTNSAALSELSNLGFKDTVISFELKSSQINALGGELPFGIMAYGRLPMMLTVNCPSSQAVGCKNCTHAIWDRTARKFPIRCSKNQGYVEILNSEILNLSDKLSEFSSPSFIRLDFFEETPSDINSILTAFRTHSHLSNSSVRYTKALYSRGVF